MGIIVENILAFLLIVGLVVGAVGYKPIRNKLIREKGYDADMSGKVLSGLALLAFALGGGLAADGNGAAMLGFAVGLVLLVINVLKRVKAIGVGSAILITLVQTLSIVWLAFVWFIKMIWGMFNGFTSHNVDVGTQQEKVSRDAQLKAQLLQEYEAKAAQAAGHSDMEAAAIAAVAKEAREYGEDK